MNICNEYLSDTVDNLSSVCFDANLYVCLSVHSITAETVETFTAMNVL